MKRFISTASMLALVTGATLSGAALAQEETISQEEGVTTLEAITVTANRTQTELSKTGSTVEQITQEEIEEKSLATVADYLNLLPGISISSSGGMGTISSVVVRGAKNYYLKTLFNGIDISDPASGQVMPHYEYLLAGGITGIEVLKGSQGTLYGSDAIAGLVDISTLGQIADGISHTVEGEGGSFGTVRGRYGFAGASGDLRLAANISGLRTDGISAAAGFPERDGYQNLTFDLAAEHRINEAFAVFGSLLHITAKGEYDDYDEDGRLVDNLENHNNAIISGARVGFDIDLMDGRLKNRFTAQASRTDREDFSDWPGKFIGDRQKIDYQGSFELSERLLLQYGADHEWQRAKTLALTASHELYGMWTQAVVEPVDNLVLTASMRHDQHSVFGGHNTWRVTASYLIDSSQTRFHSSYGTGFRAPSLYELYDSTWGNTGLKPEKSKSFDIGVEQQFFDGRLVADMTYFQLDVDNRIDWEPSGYSQSGESIRSRGVELSASYAATNWLQLGASYTYTDAKSASGKREGRVPRNMLTLSTVIRPAEKWTVSGDIKYVADTVESGRTLKDYVLVNAKAAYQLTDSTEIYLRGENLLNQSYEVSHGYGTPGIAAYAGFKANF